MEPRLYILMRTDLDSMNAGKGMAQAAHAANAFTAEADAFIRKDGPTVNPKSAAYLEWKSSTMQSFGTTITLAVSSELEMIEMVAIAKNAKHFAGVILDPSYPVRDGDVTHLLPIDTCAYIFIPETRYATLLSKLPLHP